MHGTIFAELEKYTDTRLGADAWVGLLVEANLAGKVYLPAETYDDADAYALIGATARLTRRPAAAILQDFGEFITPDLMALYGHLADPAWRTLEFLEHIEETIHRVVRQRTPGASPPDIRCARTSPTEVSITYTSHRKMCALAKGLTVGVARHYQQHVELLEPTCMVKGALQCLIVVRLSRLPPPPPAGPRPA